MNVFYFIFLMLKPYVFIYLQNKIIFKFLKVEDKWKQIKQNQYRADRIGTQWRIISGYFKTQSFGYNLVKYILNGDREGELQEKSKLHSIVCVCVCV